MNKGGNKQYSLLLQEDVDGEVLDSLEGEEEEMMIIMADEDGLCSFVNGHPQTASNEETDEDSDEEELFSSNRHRTLCNEGTKINTQINLGRSNEYHLLNNDGETKSKSLDTPLTTIWTPTPMSPARRACFIASIMFGILVVSMFLWTLPCDVQPCENDVSQKPKEWFTEIRGIGANHSALVYRMDGNFDVLLSFYKLANNSKWNIRSNKTSFPLSVLPDCTNKTNISSSTTMNTSNSEGKLKPCNNHSTSGLSDKHECGLLLLDGDAGREKWRLYLKECPVKLHCDVVDSTGDEVLDCLIMGENSMITMIEPRYGTILWDFNDQIQVNDLEKPSGRLIDPIAISDIDNDVFRDILFVHHSKTENKVEIIAVSGKTGTKIGVPYIPSSCINISDLEIENSSLVYTCYSENSKKSMRVRVPLSELVYEIMSSHFSTLEEQEVYSTLQPTKAQPLFLNGSEFTRKCTINVLNKGKCPSCQGLVSIEKDGKVLWNQDFGSHSSITDWQSLLQDGLCYGIILKVWQWHQSTETFKSFKPHPFMSRVKSNNISSIKNNPISLDINDEYIYNSKSIKYDVKVNHSDLSNENSIFEISPSVKKSAPLEAFKDPINKDYDYDTTDNNRNVKHNSLSKKRHMPTLNHASNVPIIGQIFSKKKKLYEHPTIHRHHGLQTSYIHDNIGHHSDVTTEPNYLTIPQTEFPDSAIPPGYKLQKLDENTFFVFNNSTLWQDRQISSMRISQLCYNEDCIPSDLFHKDSILIEPSLDGITTNIYVVTTSFSSDSTKGKHDDHSSNNWVSIVQKMVIFL